MLKTKKRTIVKEKEEETNSDGDEEDYGVDKNE